MNSMFDEEYYNIKNRLSNRAIASDVLYWLWNIGIWIKSFDFKFLDVSDKVTENLYWLHSNDCIGRTDFDIAKWLWIQIDEDQFANVCRASDIHIMRNIVWNKYKTFMFLEFIEDIKWKKHLWKTIKGIHPDTIEKWKYYYGIALFMDEILWSYKNALEFFKTQEDAIIKLNENLYVYK